MGPEFLREEGILGRVVEFQPYALVAIHEFYEVYHIGFNCEIHNNHLDALFG